MAEHETDADPTPLAGRLVRSGLPGDGALVHAIGLDAPAGRHRDAAGRPPRRSIVSYDFAWNLANRETVGIGARELRRLFPGLALEIHRVTLMPPLARWLGDRFVPALRVVARIAPLRSHRLAITDVPS